MRAARALSASAIPLALCMIAACGVGQSGPTTSLHKVPTSSWRPGDPSLAALARGTLQGGDENGTFCLWLVGRGRRNAIIWPAGYHARVHPVELLDANNAVVARGGDLISFGGGEGPAQPRRTCMLGQKYAFYAMGPVSVVPHH